MLSAPRRLAQEKVRWKAAPTRLRLVVCWSASAISSSLVGCTERISCGLGVCEQAHGSSVLFCHHQQAPDTGGCRMASSTNSRNPEPNNPITASQRPACLPPSSSGSETPAQRPLPRETESVGNPYTYRAALVANPNPPFDIASRASTHLPTILRGRNDLLLLALERQLLEPLQPTDRVRCVLVSV